ncbi:hypothetical protein AQUCO_03400088v1, partial [Aquilegia coerulea]
QKISISSRMEQGWISLPTLLKAQRRRTMGQAHFWLDAAESLWPICSLQSSMALKIQCHRYNLLNNSLPSTFSFSSSSSSISIPSISNNSNYFCFKVLRNSTNLKRIKKGTTRVNDVGVISAAFQPLDLTEDNVRLALQDARTEFAQIFDTSVGMTGVAELAEVDGPFVKIRLSGRFWHERSLVIARLGNYLKQRIPEILEVDIEDEKQLDDSPANF